MDKQRTPRSGSLRLAVQLLALIVVGALAFLLIKGAQPGGSLAQPAQATTESAVEPKLLTVTAILLIRQQTVEAGPLTPLPQDLDTPTPEVGPSPLPDFPFSPHRPAGDGTIVEDTDHPFMWQDKGTLNFWRANYALITVYAGWYGSDFYPGTQGALFVVDNRHGSDTEVDLTPIKDGALKLVDGKGHVLYVRTVRNNYLLSFDVDSRKFASPPDIGPIAAPSSPVLVKTGFHLSAPFTDAIPTEGHTAVVDWGDGSTTPGAVTEANGSGTVGATHSYASAGVYTVTLTVTDSAGASSSSTYRYLIAYDPNAGFVTGGGWISSPAGAYVANPQATGKAELEFDAKYPKGMAVPTGTTTFTFDTAGMTFTSTSYEWLVISGAKAQLKGSGTINGSGAFGFWLTAWDSNLAGGAKPDLFRMRIWDKGSNDVVYDSQPGAVEDADPITPLGGGSIVLHKTGQ